MIKDLDYYMALPYSKVVTLFDDKSGKYYVSEVLELSGCSSTGEVILKMELCFYQINSCRFMLLCVYVTIHLNQLHIY